MRQNEYKKIYLQESEELLQQMNSNLLVLEKEPDNESALNAIFRSAHTLKSMSASMGYAKIADLAHKMEGVLAEIRNNSIRISEELVNLMFQSFDNLQAMIEAIREGKEFSRDIKPLLLALDKLVVRAPEFSEEEVSDEVSLNEFEKRTLARAKKEGFSVYLIKIGLNKTCVLKSARAFMVFRNLHSIGEVVKSIPDTRSLEEERFESGFKCIFITKAKRGIVKNKVTEILDVEKVIIEDMPVDLAWDKELPQECATHAASPKETQLVSGGHMRKIQSVRVDITRLDKLMNLVEELAISKLFLTEIGAKTGNADLKGMIEGLSRLTDDLQNEVMQARLVPVGQIFERFPRLVRDLAKKEGKLIKFDILGADIELDRAVLDEIGDPLIHILRNSLDHGIETPEERKKKDKPQEGRLMLSARREKNHIFIEVMDDGKGMDINRIKKAALERGIAGEEALDSMTNGQIFMLTAHPGLSTKKEVTEVSGRGVGLDVAKDRVESLGGGLEIESTPDRGCKITMRLPITTAVVQALLVRVGGKAYAIPIVSVVEIIVADEGDIKKIEHEETLLHRGHVLPVMRMDRLFQSSVVSRQSSEIVDSRQPIVDSKELSTNDYNLSTIDQRLNIVIVEFGGNKFGIVVDAFLSQQDIVIKQLTRELKGIRGFAGATILGDGSVALVLDVATLI